MQKCAKSNKLLFMHIIQTKINRTGNRYLTVSDPVLFFQFAIILAILAKW